MSFTPSEERGLKLIEDFGTGIKNNDIRSISSKRLSGAFPLSSDMFQNTPITPFGFNRRPFDDTILNQNDSLIKKRKIERRSTGDSSDTFNDSSSMASPWEFRKIKGELIQAKAEISTLEAQYSKLQSLRSEEFIFYEQDKKSMKQTIENSKLTISDFELKLKDMRKREQGLKKELEELLKSKNCDVNGLEEKNTNLMEQNNQLKAKISELELKNGEVTRELNSTKVELSTTSDELKLVNEQLSKLQTQISDLKVISRQHELDKAALIIAQRKINELENDAKNYGETASMLKEQQSKLIRMSELERQLSHLKAENLNLRDAPNKILKLNEVVHDLKEKLANLDMIESLLKTTKVELGLAVHELNEYKAVCRGFVGESATHSDLNKYICELQQNHLINHADKSTLQAKLKTVEESYQTAISNCDNLKTEVSRLKSESDANNNSLRRLKKQFTITTWERDELRKMLDLLQKETTVACQDSKVEMMEKLIEGYRSRIDQMEQGMSKIFSASSPTFSQSNSAATLENLRKKNAELMQRIEKLEYEIEHRNLKGDFDTRNTKILHFKMNPTDIAVQEREDLLEKAQSDVALLREKIRIMQEAQSTSQMCDITMMASEKVNEIHSKELDDLREKVKSQELRNQRLVEAFKSTSKEFREAIYTLLGYNVASIQNKKLFKLTSMYCDSPDQNLIFQLTPGGGMELMETEMSKSFSDLIQLHLFENHSIPMFLSAITTRLFNEFSIQQSTILS